MLRRSNLFVGQSALSMAAATATLLCPHRYASTTTYRSAASVSSTTDVDAELLSILGGIDDTHSGFQQRRGGRSSSSSAALSDHGDLSSSLSFHVAHPIVRPMSLPYLLPPRWVGVVAQTLQQHFGIVLQGAAASGINNNNGSTSSPSPGTTAAAVPSLSSPATKPAPRPELFLQAFVHPSFLRSTASTTEAFSDRHESDEAGGNEKSTSARDASSANALSPDQQRKFFEQHSLASLAEVGTAVLSIAVNALASEMALPSSMTENEPKSGRGNNNNASFSSSSSRPQQVSTSICCGGNEATRNAVEAPDLTPQQVSMNLRLLNLACEDHALSLVCFNVWRVSDLVLTDAGIFGLRDALRSTQERIRVPPLTMPAAASNTRALVGAVYLNFGLNRAVSFCQIHVLAHAVEFVSI